MPEQVGVEHAAGYVEKVLSPSQAKLREDELRMVKTSVFSLSRWAEIVT